MTGGPPVRMRHKSNARALVRRPVVESMAPTTSRGSKTATLQQLYAAENAVTPLFQGFEGRRSSVVLRIDR